MINRRKIASVFFLSLFSLLNMHNLVPHTHHTHDGTQIEANHHHAIQHHEAHHTDGTSKNKGLENLISLFFGHHTYTHHTQETIWATQNLPIPKTKIQPVAITKNVTPPEDIQEDDLHRLSLFRLSLYNHPYLRSYSYRGPPSVG